MLVDEKGMSRVSMVDLTFALADEAENAAYVGKRFSVAYRKE